MKHHVTIYAVVRVKVPDVEADSHQEAMRKAEASVDLHHLFESEQPTNWVEYTAYAEQIHSWLVDEEGDEEYERSVAYDENGDPLEPPKGRCKFCKIELWQDIVYEHDGGFVCSRCWDERLRATS